MLGNPKPLNPHQLLMPTKPDKITGKSTIRWDACLEKLRTVISSADINTWIMPLHTNFSGSTLNLLAPNRYVLDYVKQNLFGQIETTILAMDAGITKVHFEIGSYGQDDSSQMQSAITDTATFHRKTEAGSSPYSGCMFDVRCTFDTHVEGKSNQLARAASIQVGKNPGAVGYNPLFIYGGVGLGKTHLMQAAGRLILDCNSKAKVLYVHSETFVNDMVKALKNNSMNQFKRYYRSVDGLLIDDIQFFAGKTQSQEEFFHTFNDILGGHRQVIMTSDRIPKAIKGVEERLISRFGSGLTVAIDPPELETRVAILEKKALERDVTLPNDVAFFVAGVVHSNVRELEGALHSILAYADVTHHKIDIGLVREALRNTLLHQKKQLSIDNIQRTVAEYYKIRVADLLSKNRSRDVARPRQLAMSFTKQFTNMSLPQIGDHFGGRDHTTVLHACRKIDELLQSDPRMKEDHNNLKRLLGG